MLLEKVISGGQTGADRAGLIAAKRLGIRTGGWMPLGYRALDGEHPEFAQLCSMLEMNTREYPPRTSLNVREAHGTLRFATKWDSPGEVLTLKLCQKYGKPHLDLTPGSQHSADKVIDWIVTNNIRVLNVAGNSEQTSPGIQEFVVEFLDGLFQTLLLSTSAA